MVTRQALMAYFADLPDPRIDRCKRHRLEEILTIAICAVICGADSFVGMERIGRAKQPWLQTIFPDFTGVPSHDTFGRVFAALDPTAFAEGFQRWVKALIETTDGEIVAIDGKTVRRSHDREHDHAALHLVSAWATTNQVVLGQVATAAKSNEITAIPDLLRLLDLHGAIATIDAMGCQTTIARQIVEGGGDYVLALKGNQGTVHELVAYHFATMAHPAVLCGTEKNHGRIETRSCRATGDAATIAWLDPTGAWAGCAASSLLRANGGSGPRECRRRGISCRFFRRMPSCLLLRYGLIVGLRLGCTGSWIWHSVRMRAGSGPDMRRRIWRWCGNWP